MARMKRGAAEGSRRPAGGASRTVAAALERADDDHRRAAPLPEPDGRPRTVAVAVGDPQAPLERFLTILDAHRLLGAEGRLRPEIQLISVGDHFDFGRAGEEAAASASAVRLLGWLAAHPPDQVVLVAGNHDLARVGELATFDDATFARARADALLAYRDGEADADEEAAFLVRWPEVPSVEVVARDFGSFRAEQRVLVERLLRSGRLHLAYARDDRALVLHAGVTTEDLATVGVRAGDGARAIAAALDAVAAAALSGWTGGRLAIPGLHRPGSAAEGEGRGILYQRPADPRPGDDEGLFAGPLRRRFDPRALPPGLTQISGHTRDTKSRALLARWVEGPPVEEGALRHLITGPARTRYAAGLPPDTVSIADGSAAMIFIDGGMNHTAVEHYRLLDLADLRPYEP